MFERPHLCTVEINTYLNKKNENIKITCIWNDIDVYKLCI
jgi:hypothetical protein